MPDQLHIRTFCSPINELPAILKTDKLKDFREKSKLYLQPIGYISIFATK
jgi:hypothetical protein